MSLVNAKGGFNVVMRVTQNSSNEVTCMLKVPFLKKAEKWSLQLTDFYINKTPPINLDLEAQLEIHPYGINPLNTHYDPSDYVFTPQNCLTVCEFVHQLQDFFRRFSYRFWRVGMAGILAGSVSAEQTARFLTNLQRGNTAVNYTKRNFIHTGGVFVDEGWNVDLPQVANQPVLKSYPIICQCHLTNELRIQIQLQPAFLANFYIRISDGLQRRLQFGGKDLFFLQAGAAANVVNDRTTAQILADGSTAVLFDNLGVPIPLIAARFVPNAAKAFQSGFSIQNLDERLSLDVTSVFPSSRKISVVDGIENHEYLLVRFDLANFKTFASTSKQNNDRMLQSTEVHETFAVGLENLTRHNPDYEANYLLPGQIQQVTLKLTTRYMENGVIKYEPTDMHDGFFHTRLLFSKKV